MNIFLLCINFWRCCKKKWSRNTTLIVKYLYNIVVHSQLPTVECDCCRGILYFIYIGVYIYLVLLCCFSISRPLEKLFLDTLTSTLTAWKRTNKKWQKCDQEKYFSNVFQSRNKIHCYVKSMKMRLYISSGGSFKQLWWHTLDTSEFFLQQRKSICVCIMDHFHSRGTQWEIGEVGRLSCFS